MNQYKKYMERQGVSPSLNARLTELADLIHAEATALKE